MKTKIDSAKLNSLKDVQFEDWHKHGVKLKAVSANSNGRVNSGILKDGRCFYRIWLKSGSEFLFD